MGKTPSHCQTDKKEVLQHLLESAHLAGKGNEVRTILSNRTDAAAAKLVPLVLLLVREASQHSYLFSVGMWTHVLCASLKDFQLLQEHMFLQPNILAQVSLSGSRVISDGGIWHNSRKLGHRGSQLLPTAVRGSFLCILVSPAEWHRHLH